MPRCTPLLAAVGTAVLGITLPIQVTTAGDLDQALRLVVEVNRAAAQSQKKIDALSDQTADLLSEFRNIQQQIEFYAQYNQQVETMVVAQREQLEELRKRIDDAAMIGREITPLMLRMLAALDQFVALDKPFLLEERTKRVAALKEMMGRPDVTEAEKFRRILEAYQIENEYGRTIETYRGKVETASAKAPRTVTFLRVGRVALAYETLDGEEAGWWNPAAKAWEPLPLEYRSAIHKGIRVARKQTAPDLFRIPVPAPTAGGAK